VIFCEAKRREMATEELRPAPLLSGRDILAMGHPPGPRIGEILRAVEDAQLDGALRTREEATVFVRERFPGP
jgi:hypothetical protein